ncbi:MAG: alpha/beta fold hydrolase [Chloroflexota bacterium]|nr:alpha/beta hydrolase [Dehalococcoidia bacterium]MDW8254957.1 alpha/beta fold hydrolase [Chloroflexota bacterium]
MVDLDEQVIAIPGDDSEPLDERLDGGIPAWLISTRRGGMCYRQVGDERAPAVVLLHAVPLSSLAWVSVLPHLAAQGMRVYALDMPGTGGTPPAPQPLSVAGYADALSAFVDALGLEQFGVIGHASHAAAALRYAVDHPDRVARLVLSKLPYLDEAGKERMGRATASWYHPDGSPAMPPIDQWTPRPQVTEQRFRVMTMRMNFDMYRAGPRSAEGHNALATYDFLADLSALRVPTRFVWTSGDHFLAHRDLVLNAAAHLRPSVRIVEGATSWPMYERPRGWAAAVGEFFAAL